MIIAARKGIFSKNVKVMRYAKTVSVSASLIAVTRSVATTVAAEHAVIVPEQISV